MTFLFFFSLSLSSLPVFPRRSSLSHFCFRFFPIFPKKKKEKNEKFKNSKKKGVDFIFFIDRKNHFLQKSKRTQYFRRGREQNVFFLCLPFLRRTYYLRTHSWLTILKKVFPLFVSIFSLFFFCFPKSS